MQKTECLQFLQHTMPFEKEYNGKKITLLIEATTTS